MLVSLAVVEDLLVHLIREYEQITFLSERCDSGQLRLVEHPACLFGELINRTRVAGVHAAASAWDVSRQLSCGSRGTGTDRPGELHHWPVRDPRWLRNQDVDAGLDKRESRFEQCLFPPRVTMTPPLGSTSIPLSERSLSAIAFRRLGMPALAT